MLITGPRYLGTYFGSGWVWININKCKKHLIKSSLFLIEDNGFCRISQAVWDLPPGEYHWEDFASPGSDREGDFSITSEGLITGDIGPYRSITNCHNGGFCLNGDVTCEEECEKCPHFRWSI